MQVRTVLAIAAWSLVGIVAFGQGSQQKSKINFGPPPTVDSRIDALQRGYQSALDNLDMTKMREIVSRDANGKTIKIKAPPTFGVNRTPTFFMLHDSAIRDTGVPSFVQTPGVQLLFWAVSAQGKPLATGKLIVHKDNATDAPAPTAALTKDLLAFATAALPSMAGKDLYSGQIEGNDAQARPLRVSKAECLPCHQESKVKDPLAIMIYMIKKYKPAK